MHRGFARGEAGGRATPARGRRFPGCLPAFRGRIRGCFLLLTIVSGLALPVSAAPEWRVLETPRFRVVSQLKEKDTRAWADEFTQFIDALATALSINERLLPPLSVVLFARERDFKPYLPRQPNGKPWAVAGFFARRETWAAIGLADRLGGEETRQTIFHEGVHWIVSAYPRYLPLCINEGLAEVYSTFAVEKEHPQWGKPIASHVDFLNREGGAMIPVEQLLLTASRNPLFNEDDRVGVFYAESWAFVHYMMFGEHEGSRSTLDDFLKAYSSGLSTDLAFRKAFGVDYATMDRKLKTYLRTGRYVLYTSRAPLTTKAPEPFVPASADSVAIALARLALGSGHLDLARKHAEEAVKLAPDNAAGYDTLACVEAQEKGDDAPVVTLEKAVQLGSKDAWTYVLLAFAKARAAVALGGIPPAESRRIADLLEQAISIRPNLLTAYKYLAIDLLEVAKVTRQDAQTLGQGLNLYPDDGTLVFGFAQLAWKVGSKEDAHKWLARALAHPEKMEQEEIARARETETRWLYEETEESVKHLMDEKHAIAALGQLDKLLGQTLPAPVRSGLVAQRRIVAIYAKIEEAQSAASEGRQDDARRLCNEILDTPNLRSDLRGMAEQMLRKLGSAAVKASAATKPDP